MLIYTRERANWQYKVFFNGLRTKIACTLGPSSGDWDTVNQLVKLGCRIFRINFSHGEFKLWKIWAENLRDVSNNIGVDCVLIADLRGLSIRFASPDKAKTYLAGQTFHIVKHNNSGNEEPSIDSSEFFEKISENDILVTDDGRGLMKVLKKDDERILVQALNKLIITKGKSLVIREKEILISNYLHHCREQIIDAIRLGADFLGLSFVTSPLDVIAVREFLEKNGSEMGLIAKIETVSAVANVEEIAKASDAVLVARGDLGMQFPLEEVPLLQEKIVKTVTNTGRPVIVATQLLGSMVSEPVPSRSEIVDVMNCVIDGVDVLMLTGETAIGDYPVESVKWLKRIIETYEKNVNVKREFSEGQVVDRFALGVVELSETLNAKIGIYTKKGNTARRISRFKPRVQVFAASNDPRTIRRLLLLWGVEPIHVESKEYEDGLKELEQRLKEQNLVIRGDTLILTYGLLDKPIHTIRIVQLMS